MKNTLTFILCLFCFASVAFSQSTDALKKGNAVYIECSSHNDNAKKLQEDITSRMKEWGYWKIASDKQQADFIMELDAEASKGITLTSWGGTSMHAKVALNSKDGKNLWESNEYQSSPNGTNGFNSVKAVAKKILRGLEKKFR